MEGMDTLKHAITMVRDAKHISPDTVVTLMELAFCKGRVYQQGIHLQGNRTLRVLKVDDEPLTRNGDK